MFAGIAAVMASGATGLAFFEKMAGIVEYVSRGNGGKHRAKSAFKKSRLGRNGKLHIGAKQIAKQTGMMERKSIPRRMWYCAWFSSSNLHDARVAAKKIEREYFIKSNIFIA